MKTISLGLVLLSLAATAGAAGVISNAPIGTICPPESVKPYPNQDVPAGIMAAPSVYSNGVAVAYKPAEWYPQLGGYLMMANTLPEALEILGRRNRPAPPQPTEAPTPEIAPLGVASEVVPLPAGQARLAFASPSHPRGTPLPASTCSRTTPPQRPCAQYVVPCGMTQDPGLRAEITVWRNQGVSDAEIQRRLNAQFPAKLVKTAPAICPVTARTGGCGSCVACPAAQSPAKTCANQPRVTPTSQPQPVCPGPAVGTPRNCGPCPVNYPTRPQRVHRSAPRVTVRRR